MFRVISYVMFLRGGYDTDVELAAVMVAFGGKKCKIVISTKHSLRGEYGHG